MSLNFPQNQDIYPFGDPAVLLVNNINSFPASLHSLNARLASAG